MWSVIRVEAHIYSADGNQYQANSAVQQLQKVTVWYAGYLYQQPDLYYHSLGYDGHWINMLSGEHDQVKNEREKANAGKKEYAGNEKAAEHRIIEHGKRHLYKAAGRVGYQHCATIDGCKSVEEQEYLGRYA